MFKKINIALWVITLATISLKALSVLDCPWLIALIPLFITLLVDMLFVLFTMVLACLVSKID